MTDTQADTQDTQETIVVGLLNKLGSIEDGASSDEAAQRAFLFQLMGPDMYDEYAKFNIAEREKQRENEIKADQIRSRIKELVLGGIGASVKGATRHAVFNAVRSTWDAKALDGYAIAHPELEKMRKLSPATVTIRRV